MLQKKKSTRLNKGECLQALQKDTLPSPKKKTLASFAKENTGKPYKGKLYQALALSRPGGRFVPPLPISQHIFKTAWSLESRLCEFSFYVSSIQKSSVSPINSHVCCHGNHATFWLMASQNFVFDALHF